MAKVFISFLIAVGLLASVAGVIVFAVLFPVIAFLVFGLAVTTNLVYTLRYGLDDDYGA